MRLAGLLGFFPQEFIPIMMVVGGLFMIIGLRKLAIMLFTLCGVMIVAPVILEPLLTELPEWALYLIMLFAVFSTGAFLISLLIGPKAWDETKGHLTANVITWIFLFPFRLLGWIFGGLFFSRRR